jgi:histidinol-phosphatase
VAGESINDLADFAIGLARDAGRITLRYFQNGVQAETKADHSPVTAADRESEQHLREEIERRFPDDGIVGEEFGAARAAAARRWILDPIDGTRSFVRGVPLFGVLIGLEEGGDAVVGVLHFPALDETVWAGRGVGCWWNGRRARVSEVSRLSEAALLATDAERLRNDPGWDRLRSRAGLTRTWGDCYGHALVATGRAEIMLDPVAALWDSAPLRPLIEEAGGVFTDWQGTRRHDGGSAVSTNSALAQEVRKLLS